MVTSASYIDLAEFIKEVLESVPAIADNGKILTKPQDLTVLKEIEDAFAAEGATGEFLFNAWVIEREGIDGVRRGAPKGEEFRFDTYLIRAYHSMNQALDTEGTFQDILTAVHNASVPAIQVSTAGGTSIPTLEWVERFQTRLITVDNFAGSVVHYAELEVLFKQRIRAIAYYKPA